MARRTAPRGAEAAARAELFALLDDRRLFEPLGRLDRIESETVFRVLRYTP